MAFLFLSILIITKALQTINFVVNQLKLYLPILKLNQLNQQNKKWKHSIPLM